MKQSTKLMFQIVIYVLLGISVFSSLLLTSLDLKTEQSKTILIILTISSMLNAFMWLYYILKNDLTFKDNE